MPTRLFKLFIAVSLFSSISGFALPRNSEPTVIYSGKRVTGIPAKQHSPTGQNIEIMETEECEAKTLSNNSIEVPENCLFLHGVYRYIFTPTGETVRHQILMDFALSKIGNGKNHTFLLNSPLEIDQNSNP